MHFSIHLKVEVFEFQRLPSAVADGQDMHFTRFFHHPNDNSINA